MLQAIFVKASGRRRAKRSRETKLGRKMNYGCAGDGSCLEAHGCANDWGVGIET